MSDNNFSRNKRQMASCVPMITPQSIIGENEEKMKTIEIIDDDISIGDMLAEVLPWIQNVPVIVLSAKIDVESFAR